VAAGLYVACLVIESSSTDHKNEDIEAKTDLENFKL